MPKLKSTEFPWCCTGKIIFNFGESSVNASGGFTPSEEDLRRQVVEQMGICKQYGHAFVCATVTQEQKIARRVLYNMGFKYSKWMSKSKHPENQVRLYWYPLSEWEG